MEQFLPLFEILLNSPCPEGEASFWLQQQQQHHNHSPNSPAAAASPSTSAFLSLLLSPAPSLSPPPPSSTPSQRIYLQTLPFSVQTSILSLLAAESRRFCSLRLQFLASHILKSDLPSSSSHPAFWVRRAACNLFDVLPDPVPDAGQLPKEDEFDSLPHWLEDVAKSSSSLLPWLPLSPSQIPVAARKAHYERRELVSRKEETGPFREPDLSGAPPPLLHPQAHEKASTLKAELLGSDSTTESLRLANEIRQICLESGAGNELMMLELIEPWEADDETLSVLLLNLSSDGGLFSKSWPGYVLCSTALPKLLTLRSPASRALLSATICFCKQHQTAAVDALVLPLVLHKEGINVVLCDVLVRIIKECLHPCHVSAFCQRLLCREEKGRRPVCVACHQFLISEEVVWTESTFNLFQHILNQEVHFTPDTNDKLASIVDEMASKFSKSLKFGNFLLCFVTKCTDAVNTHKVQLRDATEKTSTLVTRSILAKLDSLV